MTLDELRAKMAPKVPSAADASDEVDDSEREIDVDDFDAAIDELKLCHQFMDDLLNAFLCDEVSMGKDFLIRMEQRINNTFDFINEYEVFLKEEEA